MIDRSKEIYRCYDEWGVIQVHERGPYRSLVFGEEGEQSCSCIGRPNLLVHQYAQAMMLGALLAPQPFQVGVLGLGGGTLVNALCQLPQLESLVVIELRPQVLAVAENYFDFVPSSQVRVVIDDAWAWLHAAPVESLSLLMVDLYTDEGMQPMQTEQRFLFHCWEVLRTGGILVLNLWDEGRGIPSRLKQTLRELFEGALWACPVEEGNIVLFVTKGRSRELNSRRLVSDARRWQQRLDYPLHRYVGALCEL